MKRWCVLALAATGCDGHEPPSGPTEVDVTRYELSIDLEAQTVVGVLTATALRDGNCFELAEASGTLGEVTVNGRRAAIERAPASAAVVTLCGQGVFAGSEVRIGYATSLTEETLGASQVGFSHQSTGNGEFYYLLNWVEQCGRFGPCQPEPHRFATYRFTVHHPETMTVLCPGELATDLTQTTCAFDYDGGPLYSSIGVIAYDRWETRALGTWNGIEVTGYERPNGRVLDAIDPDYFAGFMTWMEATFGPYPYGNTLRIAVAPTYWAGFEHPGNIVLDDALVPAIGSPDQAIHTLLHEIVHQWAGDQTTLASTYDFVWKEAMAEYLAYVYEDQTDQALAQATRASWKTYANGAAYFPVPGEHPALFDYYGDVYGPGPMVLFRQLEGLSSRDAVIEALQTVLGAPRALAVGDVVAALEQSTGLDLEAYANAWIYGTGAPAWPRVALTGAPAENDTYRVTATVVNPPPNLMGCRFHVALRGQDAAEVLQVPVDLWGEGEPRTTWETTIAAPAFTVTSLELDPLRECLIFPDTAPLAKTTRPRGWSPWITELGLSARSQ